MATSKTDDKDLEEDVSDQSKPRWARSRPRTTRPITREAPEDLSEKHKSNIREPIRLDSVLNGYVVSRVNLSRSCGYEKGELVRDRARIQFTCGTLSELQAFWKKTQSNSGFTSEIFSRKRGMVITFTGSIGNIHDSQAIREFTTVLQRVVRATNAIVVTDGQKSRMTEFVGRMVQDLNKKRGSREKFVAVAMVPLSNIQTDLEEYQEKDLFEPNHSRLFIVRPGLNSKEHDAMEFVEKVIATDPLDSTYVLPRVVVAFGGGIETLRKVYAAVDNGTVVHFVKHSGGVTDLLIAKKNDKQQNKGALGLDRQDTSLTMSKTPVMPVRNSDRLLVEVLGKGHLEEGRRILEELNAEKLQYCRECSLDMLSNFVFLEGIRNPRRDFKVLCHNVIERGQDLFEDIMDKQQMADLLFENLNWDDLATLYKNMPTEAHLSTFIELPSFIPANQRQVFDEINRHLEKTIKAKTAYSLPTDTRLAKKPTHKDFFVWYILTEQLDTAHMLWMKSNQMAISDAFLASSLLDGLQTIAYGDKPAVILQEASKGYIDHVTNIMNEGSKDTETPNKRGILEAMLINRHFNYFDAAYDRNKSDFFKKGCVREVLRRRWYGELEEKLEKVPKRVQTCFGSFPTNEVRYMLAMAIIILAAMPFFAFALPFFMVFKKDAIDNFLIKYNIAALKCCMHSILHVIFLIVYAYMLLLRLPDYWTGTDLVMIGWVFCISLEELRKIFVIRGHFFHKMKTYFNWRNTLDFCGVLLFFVGMVLRLGAQKQDAARVCFAIDFLFFFGRIFALFYVSGLMGPKLVVFGKMFRESMLPILAYIFLLLIAFTIADYAVLYPNSDFDWYFLENVMKNGYWLVYKEIGLSELELSEPQCSNNETLYMDGTIPRCPSSVGQSAAPYFRGLFVLLAVLLLINVLIATFIESYNRVQDESYMHWLLIFRGVIDEHKAKGFLPPPYGFLFLFVGVIFLIVWLVALPIRLCCAKSKVSDEEKERTFRKKPMKQNHINNGTSENGVNEKKKEGNDFTDEEEESRTLNFYEGMEVFMKIFVAMPFKDKIERESVRTFEKAMKQKYVTRIAPAPRPPEEGDILRDQVDRTEILERLLTQQDKALKKLEKRTARIEEDLDDMDKWMDGVDKTLAIYRGASGASRRSRGKSRGGSRPVSQGADTGKESTITFLRDSSQDKS